MRSLLHSKNFDAILAAAVLLDEHHIEYSIDQATNIDWSQEAYGTSLYTLWIIDEDAVGTAQELLKGLEQNPAMMKDYLEKALSARHKQLFVETIKEAELLPIELDEPHALPSRQQHPITILLAALISALYLLSLFFPTSIFRVHDSYVQIRSPLEKALLFDSPKALTTFENFLVENLQKRPNQESYNTLFSEVATTTWPGLVAYLTPHTKRSTHYQLFEKIGSGELWRLWTPTLLHISFLHYAFNLFWLLLLSPVVELLMRSKTFFIFFLLFLAATTNIAQYLMTGYNFLGISGVVCGLAGYLADISRHQRLVRPAKGYYVEDGALRFLQFFIFACALVSILFFFIHLTLQYNFSLGIANTAHITGWYIGALFGRRNRLCTNRGN